MQTTSPIFNRTLLTSQSLTKNPNRNSNYTNPHRTTMATTLLLAAFAALAQARVIPILPILAVRDPLSNTSTPAPAGGNSTFAYPGFNAATDPAYKHSAAWKVYLAFFVIGIVMAVILPLLGAGLWYRARRSKSGKQPEEGVEMSRLAKLKARAGVEGLKAPQNAHVRGERYA